MYINLSGLHVLLTGATHSLGKAIATKLGEAGATLALQYHTKRAQAEELAYTLSNNSRSFQADLSNRKQRSAFFDKVFSDTEKLKYLLTMLAITYLLLSLFQKRSGSKVGREILL